MGCLGGDGSRFNVEIADGYVADGGGWWTVMIVMMLLCVCIYLHVDVDVG